MATKSWLIRVLDDNRERIAGTFIKVHSDSRVWLQERFQTIDNRLSEIERKLTEKGNSE